MAKKQKAQDKTDLKDDSIKLETDIDTVSYTHLTLPTKA